MSSTVLSEISDLFRETIETANLDWQVSQYRYYRDKAHEHSANEVLAAAICYIGCKQHGTERFVKEVGYADAA